MPPSDHVDKPKVRTRQGCLTCRKRRRKCDEQKPRCQNCAGRGLDCRYGLKLTFLPNNVSSLDPEDAQALKDIVPTAYKNIRFIHGSDEGETLVPDELKNRDSPEPLGLSHGAREGNGEIDDSSSEIDRGTSAAVQENSQMRLGSLYGQENDEGLIDTPAGQSNHSDYGNPQQITAGYSSAIDHSHLGLPTATQERATLPGTATEYDETTLNHFIPQSSRILSSLSPGSGSGPNLGLNFNNNAAEIGIQSEYPRFTLQTPGLLQLPVDSETQNQLLKFYVDEVAPRLDVCTSQNSFATRVPAMSKHYWPLLLAVLALSAQQQSSLLHLDSVKRLQGVELARLARKSIGSDTYSSRDEALFACTLLMVNQLLSAQVQDWRHLLEDRIHFLDQLGIDGFSDSRQQRSPWSWIMLKLDLSVSLFYSTPLMTTVAELSPLSNLLSNGYNQMALDQEGSDFTRRAILLCAQAAQFCFTPYINNNTTANPAKDTWVSLWNSTLSWTTTLPPHLLPVLETPISAISSTSPTSFPLILHTNRSNMHATVMHHITAILLLQRKPPDERSSSHVKNPTWHAVQICGICIGNNSQWSYDPTILASLIYAGRFISYWEQKKELLGVLRSFLKDSGWQVCSAVDDLVDRWQVDSGQLERDPEPSLRKT